MREICDRYGVLLVSDEVICAFGRLGHMFGCERYDYLPDMITTAKGLTSGYSPLGGDDRPRLPGRAVPRGASASFLHGITFGGHPVSCAVALAQPRHLRGARTCSATCAPTRPGSAQRLEALRDLPIVGDVRGAGYFWAIELVKDQDDRASVRRRGVRGAAARLPLARLFEAGLICRADDRGDPVIQLSPPLIAGPEEFDEIETILRTVLDEAWRAYQRRR